MDSQGGHPYTPRTAPRESRRWEGWRSVSKLRGLRVAIIGVSVASLVGGSHLVAGRVLATVPTPTAVYIYNPPPTWVVNQPMTVQTWVSTTVDGGTIQLKIDGTSYDTKPVAQAGWTEFSWTPDTKKAYSLQVFYSGTASFAASQSDVASVTVIPP